MWNKVNSWLHDLDGKTHAQENAAAADVSAENDDPNADQI